MKLMNSCSTPPKQTCFVALVLLSQGQFEYVCMNAPTTSITTGLHQHTKRLNHQRDACMAFVDQRSETNITQEMSRERTSQTKASKALAW